MLVELCLEYLIDMCVCVCEDFPVEHDRWGLNGWVEAENRWTVCDLLVILKAGAEKATF